MDLKRALQIIEGGAWLSLRFITSDIAKGTGGRVIELAKCRLCRPRPGSQYVKADPQFAKAPDHNFHFTRNVELHGNKQIRKVHPILITHVNQEAVV